jgi:hypothetical protein
MENRELGYYEPLVTFSSTNQYITLFYVYFWLKYTLFHVYCWLINIELRQQPNSWQSEAYFLMYFLCKM